MLRSAIRFHLFLRFPGVFSFIAFAFFPSFLSFLLDFLLHGIL